MTHENQTPNSDTQATRSNRLGESVLIATMIVLVVVALGVSTSFELAAVFSTCLGALVTLAAAGARLLGQPGNASDAPVQARLVQAGDDSLAAKS